MVKGAVYYKYLDTDSAKTFSKQHQFIYLLLALFYGRPIIHDEHTASAEVDKVYHEPNKMNLKQVFIFHHQLMHMCKAYYYRK